MATGPDIVRFIEAGLQAGGLRGKVIANNLANLNTPGFRRGEVRFEEMLSRAMTSGRAADAGEVAPEVYCPGSTPINDQGSDVNLDLEIGLMVKNGGTSRVLLRTLSKLYRQMELAASDRV
ncbi:MAG TPA: flagellar basal body protein [Phycisphaerae bacterium]|nr:flagellar basal body protein [Phycisphaerae bacterium]